MRILVAEDDPSTLRLISRVVEELGAEVTCVEDGTGAWSELWRDPRPSIAVLDWNMPGLDGVTICARARAAEELSSVYLILVTMKSNLEDIVEGLNAGADDYVVKPFRSAELRARIGVGLRVARLHHSLAQKVHELEQAVAKVRQLEGLLPICGYCKRVRDDKDYWSEVETYVSNRLDVQFSHSVCPDCYEKHVKPMMGHLRARESRRRK
jgi:sigma-B regulation protein RsbU (phosphoserine phosphatase)